MMIEYILGKSKAEIEKEMDMPLGCTEECQHINCRVLKFIDSEIVKIREDFTNNSKMMAELEKDMAADDSLLLLTKAKKGLATIKIMDELKNYLTYRSAELMAIEILDRQKK